MKRVICLCLALCLALSAAAFAEGFDLENMNSTELNALKSAINSELERNHDPSSTQETRIEDVFKKWIEDYYGGSSNVNWPWFDYSYTREWDFFTITTRAEITKRDGGKASYNLFGELYLTDSRYTIVYVKVGNEVLLDEREAVITDPRVLKLLGFDVASEDTPVADEPAAGQTYDNETGSTASTAAQDAEPAVTPTPRPTEIPFTPIQRGDKGDEVKRIQQRLIDLNFLDGAADGSFGKGTEASVCAFQKAAGLPITGIVDKDTYDMLFSSNAPKAEPKPESITVSQLVGAFENNELAATDKYVGVTLDVSGRIYQISTDLWGNPQITLDGGEWSFDLVWCNFPRSEKDALSRLSSGQRIVIRGTVSSGSSLGVTLKDCEIVY